MKRVPDNIRQKAKREAADQIDKIMEASAVLEKLRPLLSTEKPPTTLRGEEPGRTDNEG